MNLLQSKINHILLAVLISTLVSCGAGKNGFVHVERNPANRNCQINRYQPAFSQQIAKSSKLEISGKVSETV